MESVPLTSFKNILQKYTTSESSSENIWLIDFRKKMEERKKNWSEEKRLQHEKFLSELKKAYDALQKRVITNILNMVDERIKENQSIRLITIRNWETIDDFEIWKEEFGFHPINIIKGFWDMKSLSYKRFTHIEAGIDLSFEDDIVNKLAPFGYIIHFVDDTKLLPKQEHNKIPQLRKQVLKVKLVEF